jgi:HSP20 family protein
MMYRTAVASPVFSLRREIDRLFDDTIGGNGGRTASTWTPSVDVRESANELTLAFEMPGIAPDQIEVTTDNGVLTVRGEKREERKEGDDSQFHLVERSYGAFSRSFQLPKNLDESGIEASFENGVLTVRIPKAALPQPKKIEVSAGSRGGSKQIESGESQSAQRAAATNRSSSKQTEGGEPQGAKRAASASESR